MSTDSLTPDLAVQVFLAEYQEQCLVQKEAKNRFMQIAILHNSGVASGLLWMMEKLKPDTLLAIVNKTEHSGFVAVFLILNLVFLIGAGYQVYSFFSASLRIDQIRQNMSVRFGEQMLESESDLGQFADRGVWLAQISNAIPVIIWFSGPVLVLLGGVILSVQIFHIVSRFEIALFVISDILSIFVILYLIGLGQWFGSLPKNVAENNAVQEPPET